MSDSGKESRRPARSAFGEQEAVPARCRKGAAVCVCAPERRTEGKLQAAAILVMWTFFSGGLLLVALWRRLFLAAAPPPLALADTSSPVCMQRASLRVFLPLSVCVYVCVCLCVCVSVVVFVFFRLQSILLSSSLTALNGPFSSPLTPYGTSAAAESARPGKED